MYHPNLFAHILMLLWIPLGLVAVRQWGAQRGILLALIGGTLILPVRLVFDPPILVPLDKSAFAALSAYFGWLSVRSTAPERHNRSAATRNVLLLMIVSTALTSATNTDMLVMGPRRMAGLNVSYAVGVAINSAVTMGIPYYLGHILFRTERDLRLLLTAFLIAAAIYAVLALIEARFSPILHRNVYGFFQHSWKQMKRDGGFRAIVFLTHGLAVALLLAQGLLLSAASARLKHPLLQRYGVLTGLTLLVSLIACKSMGAMIIAALGVPIILYTSAGTQLRVARWLGMLVLLYPVLRMAELVPLDGILAAVRDIDINRAASLQFRIDNEVDLLTHARKRLLFGWGGWGRNRVYDVEGGDELSVVDGMWIKTLGSGGLLWYATIFGTVLMPIFSAKASAARLPRASDELKLLSGAMLVLAFGALDLLPNSMFHPLPFLLAGAIQGYCSNARGGPSVQSQHTV